MFVSFFACGAYSFISSLPTGHTLTLISMVIRQGNTAFWKTRVLGIVGNSRILANTIF